MSLLRTRHPDEMPLVRPRAVPATTLPPLPLGAPARAIGVLGDLRAADRTLGIRRPSAPIPPRPIALTDWSARLADDWTHVNARWDNLTDALARERASILASYEYGMRVLTAPVLAWLAETVNVWLPAERKAEAGAASDELAWIDAEMAVAL